MTSLWRHVGFSQRHYDVMWDFPKWGLPSWFCHKGYYSRRSSQCQRRPP